MIDIEILKNMNEANEISGIALTNVSTGEVIEFFKVAIISPIVAVEGAASGSTFGTLLGFTALKEVTTFNHDVL